MSIELTEQERHALTQAWIGSDVNRGVEWLIPIVEQIIAARLRRCCERIAVAIEAHRIMCPVHKIPDCSPLLNGCGLPNQVHPQARIDAQIARQEQP